MVNRINIALEHVLIILVSIHSDFFVGVIYSHKRKIIGGVTWEI
jgi:hypothetical protein